MSIWGTWMIAGAPIMDWGQLRRSELGLARGIRHSWVIELEVELESPEGEVARGSGSWEGNAFFAGPGMMAGREGGGLGGRVVSSGTCHMVWNCDGKSQALDKWKDLLGWKEGRWEWVGHRSLTLTFSSLCIKEFKLPHQKDAEIICHLSPGLMNSFQRGPCLQSLPFSSVSSTYCGARRTFWKSSSLGFPWQTSG